jgi:M-phase inducer tyrosine phosphatase
MTTPPLPSSSPAGTFDVMDMSPLPHKTPFAADIDLDMESPTADISMAKSQLQSRISFRNSPGSGQPEYVSPG